MPAGPLHHRVFDAVGSRIVTGKLAPGDVVNLAEIEEEFGVSRTVAREAMRLLEAYGLIEVRRRVGLIVAPAREWTLVEPNFVRWMMESGDVEAMSDELMGLNRALAPEAARRAARRATPEERARFKRLATTMRELLSGDPAEVDAEFLAAEREFAALAYSSSRTVLISSIAAQTLAVNISDEFFRAGRTAGEPWVVAFEDLADALWLSDSDRAVAAATRIVNIGAARFVSED